MKWFDRLIAVFYRPVPQTRSRGRFPRKPCSVCGKSLAMTSRGLWPHTCLLPESLCPAADVRPVPRGKGTAGSPDLASTALTGD